MCVLSQSASSALTDEQLLDLILTQAPGSIARLDQGVNLLLANCGRAESLLFLAQRFPRSRFYGLEASAYERGAARQAVRASMRQNVWIQPDAVHLPDLTGTFHFALRLPHANGVDLPEIAFLLKPGGLLFDLHFTAPGQPLPGRKPHRHAQRPAARRFLHPRPQVSAPPPAPDGPPPFFSPTRRLPAAKRTHARVAGREPDSRRKPVSVVRK